MLTFNNTEEKTVEKAIACMRSNLKYGKNQNREDVKSHHDIISFDPRDAQGNGLTVDRAQALGEEFCRKYFTGHQALVCTHPNGHNHSGNIHVHIVINSLRIAGAENGESKESLPGTARKRVYHFRICRPLFQGKGNFQAASDQNITSQD